MNFMNYQKRSSFKKIVILMNLPLKLISTVSYKVPEYLCINLRISCLAAPSSSHSFANCTFNFSTLLLISFPLSLRHRSIASRTSIPTASRDPAGVSPFLCKVLSPSPLLTWNSSKPAWRFSVMCAALAGWSPTSGKKILQKNW